MTDEAINHLEQTIAAACRLTGGNATVRSVSVVGGRRLSAAELLRSHGQATACDVRLTMDGAGVVTLRARCTAIADDRPPVPRDVRALLLPRLRLRRPDVTGTGPSIEDEGRAKDANPPPYGHT